MQAERNDDDDADMLDDDGDDANADDNLFSMLGDIEAFNANRGLRVRFDLEPYDEAKELELQKRKRPPTPRPKPSEVPNDDDDDTYGESCDVMRSAMHSRWRLFGIIQ